MSGALQQIDGIAGDVLINGPVEIDFRDHTRFVVRGVIRVENNSTAFYMRGMQHGFATCANAVVKMY